MKKKLDNIVLEDGYIPSNDEPYMCDKHLAYFRSVLLKWRNDLLQESNMTVSELKAKNLHTPDSIDAATTADEVRYRLRTTGRCKKLIHKIECAIDRIEQGEYGYCEETGEPIGIARLQARPITKLSIEAQENHERFEKSHSDEDEVIIESYNPNKQSYGSN